MFLYIHPVLVLFYGIPAAAVVWFGIALCRYLAAKRKNKSTPDTYSAPEMKKRKWMLIAAAVTMGVLLAVVLGIAGLLLLSITFM